MADWPKFLTEGAESSSVGRMRVNDAVHIRARFHNFGMDENLGMTLVLAFDFLAGRNIDNDDMLRTYLFETETVRLH